MSRYSIFLSLFLQKTFSAFCWVLFKIFSELEHEILVLSLLLSKNVKFCEKKFADLFFRRIFAVPKDNRGVAQLVSASGLGPEGPVFESQYPD